MMMKAFLALLLSAHVFSTEIQVSRMKKRPGLDHAFTLKTNIDQEVVLDCQSFLQGITIGGQENFYLMLEPEECADLEDRISASLRHLRHHCLDISEGPLADYVCP